MMNEFASFFKSKKSHDDETWVLLSKMVDILKSKHLSLDKMKRIALSDIKQNLKTNIKVFPEEPDFEYITCETAISYCLRRSDMLRSCRVLLRDVSRIIFPPDKPDVEYSTFALYKTISEEKWFLKLINNTSDLDIPESNIPSL